MQACNFYLPRHYSPSIGCIGIAAPQHIYLGSAPLLQNNLLYGINIHHTISIERFYVNYVNDNL
ncbi:hypothetical protein F0231_14555 [Vibrio sp. RE86]|nr:hypothetical protein [Vibrio sp. RE86]